MPETIPAHIPGPLDAAATAAAVDSAAAEAEGDSAAAARRRVVGDEEFPFACGTISGVKCCSKCGATKTPQWREGPLGEPCAL